MTPPLVLIVEDEAAQMELLTWNFGKEGYQVITADNGEEGLLRAKEETPHLIILDWMLPELSGIEVCRQLKRLAETREIPVIMLTARGEEADRIRGLDTGADDYVVKPYSVRELLARSRAMLRRANPATSSTVLCHGDLRLDREQHKVWRQEKPISLGPTEYRLLEIFLERPERVWTRDKLLERAWDHASDIDYRTVDVHVGRLRRALKVDGLPDPIRTIRSVGYSLDFEAG